jgi:hypothetical protein
LAFKGGVRRTTTGNYLAGSRMTVSCEQGYVFFGHPEYICHPNGTWLPSNNVPLHRFKDWPTCERMFLFNYMIQFFMFKTLFHFQIIISRE